MENGNVTERIVKIFDDIFDMCDDTFYIVDDILDICYDIFDICYMFDDIFDIVDADYHPKPEAKAFDLMIKKFDIDPKETIYIEDIAKNLSIGKERGATTVWLINNEYWGKKESDKDYIDYKIENLSLFLKEIRILKNS